MRPPLLLHRHFSHALVMPLYTKVHATKRNAAFHDTKGFASGMEGRFDVRLRRDVIVYEQEAVSRDGEWKVEEVSGTTGGLMSRDVARQLAERRVVTATQPM
jgi:hypothetical protein